MHLFELEHVSVGYSGQTMLHDVSLRIAEGERVALVGPSGAGKSTLLAVLYEHQRAETALVPQDSSLVPTLSVFHNVYMGRLHRHAALYNLANLLRPFPREVAAVRAILRTLGLEEKLFEPVGELSGGQQQRTAVGRALFQGGRVLLGDEPVSAVDGLQARAVLQAINDTYDTVVLAMHDVGLALAFTERIVALSHGRVVLDCSTRGLTPADIKHVYTEPDASADVKHVHKA
ncbi:MAG: ATP-binding cassette domain-containing protein [Candidatus Lambdaproteobacteria bacterium]|nr:ATP-binding cassette domain-containing protein [Candidatus Lambdaproteobacteria bacterium]